MKVCTSGSNSLNATGECYTKRSESIHHRLALYEDNTVYFSKKGDTYEDSIVKTVDLSCGGTFKTTGKSIHLKLDGLKGEMSKVDMETGSITDEVVTEEGGIVVVTAEELAEFWKFGKWSSPDESSDSE